MEFIDNNSVVAPREGVKPQDFWLLALRLLSSFALVYFQGWQQIDQAWRYVWEKAEWPLVAEMAKAGLPMTNVLAPVFAALLIIVAAGILLGFLTRIVAIIGMLLCSLVLVFDFPVSDTLNVQSLTLHAGLLLVLTISGGGRFSLGTLLSRKRDEI